MATSTKLTGQSVGIAPDTLCDFLACLPGDESEWTLVLQEGGIVRGFRHEPGVTEPESGLGWTRAYINLVTGEWDVSEEAPDIEAGIVFPHLPERPVVI